MNLVPAVVAVLVAVAIAVALGLIWRARTGRARTAFSGAGERELAEVAAAHGRLGDRATLLQFSTEFCSPCRVTARVLDDLAARRDGIAHVEVDLTDRIDLARRLNILQTPTTFVLDPDGRSRARIGGAPRLAEVVALLDSLHLHDAEAPRVHAA
jgi:thiol-disulfide isomerase/thioredoxin